MIKAENYGAIAGDAKDDTQSLRRAFAELGNGKRLLLDEGVYIVSGGFTLHGLKDARVIGRSSEFLMKGVSRSRGNGAFTLFTLKSCQDLAIRGIRVEMDPLAHSEGRVVTVNSEKNHFDLELFPEYRPVRGDEKVAAMMNHFPDGVPRGTFDYVRGTAERVSDRILRVHTPKAGRLEPGEIIAIRHRDYLPVAFRIVGCHGVRLEDSEVWSAGGGISAYQSSDLTIKRFHVRLRPGTKRLLSTNADGMHFTYCHGKLRFLGCELTGHGDDAINFHGFFMKIASVDKEQSILEFDHVARGRLINNYTEQGDSVLIYDAQLLPLGTAKVVSASKNGNHGKLELDSLPPDAKKGGYLISLRWMPEVEIRDCTIGRNRARGILLQSHKVRVENNRFFGSTGAAILVSSDIDYWFESAPTRDIVIRGNRIERVNHWDCCQEGAITINTCHGGQFTRLPAGVHTGIVIEDNEILETDYAGIFVGSARGVTIRRNRIEKWGQKPRARPWGGAAIVLKNVRDARVLENETVGEGAPFLQENAENVTRE